jgi:hypothetical protein
MYKKRLLFIIPIALLTFPVCVFAAFTVSARPYEGGYDLDFRKVGFIETAVNKEVIVRTDSEPGKQYRLIQTLFEPLTNSQGISLTYGRNFVVYAVRGSNRYGTISVEQENPVSPGRTIVYTSNPNGDSDQFTLVYALVGPFDVPSGIYRGRIGLTLEAVDSAQPPQTVFLNVTAEIEAEAGIEIKSPSGLKIISLSGKEVARESSDVLFTIRGGFGRQFRILQLLSGSPTSSSGDELPYDAIMVSLKDVNKGSGPAQPVALSGNQQIVYTSSMRGEAESFSLDYILNEIPGAKAGRYKVGIGYFLQESSGAPLQKLDSYILEAEIEKVFDLFLKTESGQGSISFRDIGPNQPPRTFEVEVQVKSNSGRPYLVTQKMLSPLANKEGNTILNKYFSMKTEKLKQTKGLPKVQNKSEMTTQDTTLFVSDRSGSSDTFKVIYELNAASDVKAGDYATSIVYSLSEL